MQNGFSERGHHQITRSVAGSGRLTAASVPNGRIAGGAGGLDFNRERSWTWELDGWAVSATA